MNADRDLVIAGAKGLFILFGCFFVCLVFSALAGAGIGYLTEGSRTGLLLSSCVQGIFAFCLPAWITGKILTGRPASFLCLDNCPSWRPVVGLVIVFAIGLPAINQLIVWNESLHFPEALEKLERTFRQWEESNGSVSEKLLSTSSIGGLVSGILVIGILTGICEEVFFRGGLQKLLNMCGLGRVSSIWTAAFIFSAIHFQFFGFVPRLLLGAFFGFLLIRTASLWTSIIAHSLNNSIVVVSYWLTAKGIVDIDAGSIGVASEGSFPWWGLASAVALILFFRFGSGYFFVRNDRD